MTEYIVCPHCYKPLSQREYVKVVRCSDCKHHYEGKCMLTDGMGDFKRWFVNDDDYCSDGEKAVDE